MITKSNGYFIFTKNLDLVFPTTRFFKTNEMQCKCSYSNCEAQTISVELLDRLTKLRTETGIPIGISSAYRCVKHQLDIAAGGAQTAKNSQHCLGNATDIFPTSKDQADFDKLYEVCYNGLFTSIGDARHSLHGKFIHVDLRPLKPDNTMRLWKYV